MHGKFKILNLSCFDMVVDAIKSGFMKNNEDVELNCLVFKYDKKLSGINALQHDVQVQEAALQQICAQHLQWQ
jgi:hypothetical protein